MKKIITTLIACAFINVAYAIPSQTPTKKVLISQVIDHPALNKTTQGIIAGLAEKGWVQKQNVEIRVESAQANAALALQIANKFIAQRPDIIVGVGTISAQPFVKAATANGARLIFSSVTDPVAAHLQQKNARMLNIAGVSNFVEVAPQLQMFKKILPNLKRLGVIYNPGEINSVAIIARLEEVCPQLNIELKTQAVTKTADVAQAVVRLTAGVDAIFISNDNTALSSLQSIIKAAQKNKIPVFVSDTDAVSLGALAAFGPNQYALGQQTGYMIARVLDGTDINTLSIEIPQKVELVVNLAAARRANITIPQDVIASAHQVIGDAA